MCKLDRTRHAGAESDTVIGAVDVVVHRLRNRDDADAFVVESFAVAERVVATDRYQRIDPDVLQIPEHVFRDVVDLLGVAAQVLRHSTLRQVTRPGPRGVEESSAGSAGAMAAGLR